MWKKWVVAGALVLVAGLVFFFAFARGNKKAQQDALADAIDAWHGPRVQAAKEHADEAVAQFSADSQAAKDAQAKLDGLKAELQSKHANLGLSAEESTARLSGLRV